MPNFKELPAWKRLFEKASFLLTLYSVCCLIAEMEFDHHDRSVGLWLWNERLLATVFTIEYLFRWYKSGQLDHCLKWSAIIDLVAIAPFYVGFLVSDDALDLIRVFRVLRVLRVYRYSKSLSHIKEAYDRCRYELWTVASFVLVVTVITSAFMYQLEHEAQPDKVTKFSDALWWAVVTMATVGYGDISPVTTGGRAMGAVTIIVGVGCYGVMFSLFGGAWADVLKEHRKRADLQNGNGGTP